MSESPALRLSRKLPYVLEAVLDIAWNGESRAIPALEITERQRIAPRMLEQMLQGLVRAGILLAQRGPRGGYRLARPREAITLAEIVRVVQEIDLQEQRRNPPPPLRSPLGRQVVEPVWQDVSERFFAGLEGITLAMLCARAADAGVPQTAAPDFDFVI